MMIGLVEDFKKRTGEGLNHLNSHKAMRIQGEVETCNVEEAHFSLLATQKSEVLRPSDRLGQGVDPSVSALANKVPDAAGGESCTQLKLQENG